jgi:hypothetical protein
MRNAALLGVIGGAVGMVVGFFGYGVAAPAERRDGFFLAMQELGSGRIVNGPLIGKLIVLAAPMAGIPAAALRRAARPSPASSWSFRPSASSGVSTSTSSPWTPSP